MKHIITLGIIVFAGLGTTFAQPASSAVPFLLISPDSRSGGYGEGGVAMAGIDPNTIFWNPAALYRIKDVRASLTHSTWLPQFQADLFYDYLAMTYPLDEDFGTIGAHVTFLSLGEHTRTNENGDVMGTFKGFETAIGVSYGVQVNDDLSIGVGGRFIYSRLSPFGTANEKGQGIGASFGMDIALEYHPQWDPLLKVGLTITNMGPKMTYIDEAQADPLPTNFRLGASYKVFDDPFFDLTVYADMSKLMVTRNDDGSSDSFGKALITSWTKDGFSKEMTKSTLSMGGEFVYDKFISLRSGYFYENKDFGNRRFMTYGAGVVFNFLSVDFSYISAFEESHPLAGTVRMTLGLNISQL